LGKAEADTEAEPAETEAARYPRVQNFQHSSLLLSALEPARIKERQVGKPYFTRPTIRKTKNIKRPRTLKKTKNYD
jgi:hypothetical protein